MAYYIFVAVALVVAIGIEANRRRRRGDWIAQRGEELRRQPHSSPPSRED